MTKRKDRTDKILGIGLALTFISFWTTIIAGFFGDQNIVAPWSTLTYMVCAAIVMYKSIGIEVKGYFWRNILGTILLWAVLIIPYIIILACKGLL